MRGTYRVDDKVFSIKFAPGIWASLSPLNDDGKCPAECLPHGNVEMIGKVTFDIPGGVELERDFWCGI